MALTDLDNRIDGFSLDFFADKPVWVAWRGELRDGKVTKVPYRTPSTKAKADSPTSWTDAAHAAGVADKIVNGHGGGIGIIIGIDCKDGWRLGGIDLDSCIHDGDIADWAADIIRKFDSYTEISPSGSGVKIYFTYREADLIGLRALMGGAQHSKMYRQPSGDDHGPAIELHLSNRYFAVTGDGLGNQPIRQVDFETVQWVITQAGPAFAGTGDRTRSPTAGASSPGSSDQSRSAIAYRLTRWLRNTGEVVSYDEYRQALMDDPRTTEWVSTKGLANNERELQRLWEHTEPHEFVVLTWRDIRDTLAAEAEGEIPAPVVITGERRKPISPELWVACGGDPLPKRYQVFNAGLDPDWIPPREWLLGNTFCRKFVSSLFADGGTGKTALRVAQAVSLATNRKLTDEHVFTRCRVLYMTLEDDRNELMRRIRACCLHHKIPKSELDGWFHYVPLNGPKLAVQGPSGKVQSSDLVEILREIITGYKIDLVILDPFVKTHGVNENDNNAIDQVSGILSTMAIEMNIAVDAPHHNAKGAADPGNANRGRGASAWKDGGRLAYTMTTMSKDDAESVNMTENDRWRYLRVDSGKVNIAPRGDRAKWYRLVSVKLNNTDPIYTNGDEVQTVEYWKPPLDIDSLADDVVMRYDILDKIKAAPADALYVMHPSSRTTVWPLFQAYESSIAWKQVKQIIDKWAARGLVNTGVEFKDEERHRHPNGLSVD